jgi:PAS domain-containing protein
MSQITASTVGHWSCDLLTERIEWDDGVYDLFGLPRSLPLDRATAIRRYDRQSLIEMECARTQAILDKSGFTLDVRITTISGERRTIRIVAAVESEGGKAMRLAGTKTIVSD